MTLVGASTVISPGLFSYRHYFWGSDFLPHFTTFDDLFDFLYCVYGGILQGQSQ